MQLQTPTVSMRCQRAAAAQKRPVTAIQRRGVCLYATATVPSNARNAIALGLLGIPGLHDPVDCLSSAVTTVERMQQIAALAADPAELAATSNDMRLRMMSIAPAFELLSQRHPDSAWRRAAAAAALLLDGQCCRLLGQLQQQQNQSPTAAISSSSSSTNSFSDSWQLPRKQQAELNQLEEWLHELDLLESSSAAAAVKLVHAEECSPVLLLTAAVAQQHPVWAAAYRSWQQQQQDQNTAVAAPSIGAQAATISSSSSSSRMLIMLPEVEQLAVSDTVSIPVASYYSAAASNSRDNNNITVIQHQKLQSVSLSNHAPLHANHETSDVTSGPDQKSANNMGTLNPESSKDNKIVMISSDQVTSSSVASGSNEEMPTSLTGDTHHHSVMPFPLTAAAAAALLSSPPGVLTRVQLAVVYEFGVLARLQVAAAAVDLVWMVEREKQDTEIQINQLKQIMTHQQTSSKPLAVETSNSSSSSTTTTTTTTTSSSSSSNSLPGSAVSQPVAVLQFLNGLAAYSRTAAAEEVQGWLSTGYKFLQQQQQQQQLLTDDFSNLQQYQVEGLRQVASLTECEKIAAATAAAAGGRRAGGGGTLHDNKQANCGSSSSSSSSSSVEVWLQDYTATEQLLTGACEVLSSLLNLKMTWQRAPPHIAWCQHAFVIDVTNNITPDRRSSYSRSSSNSSSDGTDCHLGDITVLFDDGCDGMPYTTLISQGGHYQADVSTTSAAQQDQHPSGSSSSSSSSSDQTFQPCKVAIIFPVSFYLGSSSSSSGTSTDNTGSSSSSSGTSTSSINRLSTTMHELGHALHFILSSTAAAATAADCCCHAHTDLLEIPSHLVERMTRDVRCLQILLRHTVTQQPPPLNLTKQLQAHIVISSRGAHQWQQHLIAAVADARLAAAAAGVDEQPSCWEVVTQCCQEYDPLGQASPAVSLLSYLPAMAAVPGELHCYITAELVAAAIWTRYLQADPLDPAAGLQVRRLLFEASAAADTATVVQRVLGTGSMMNTAGQVPASSGDSSTSGDAFDECVHRYVPNLDHPAYHDIDLWG